MYLSRVLMILALAILAYLVWITMSDCDTFKNDKKKSQENFVQVQEASVAPVVSAPVPAPVPSPIEHMNNKEEIVYNVPVESAPKINYEHFQANVDGVTDTVNGAAPFAGKSEMDEGKFATVKYSGLVDAKPGDIIQIEGTDLLTAPLVDNMLYTNSIANTNRNASNDLRGDIPLQFNDTYTPFYSSVIYGAPLSQKQMTISKI
jgi:hypothetical protein